MTATQHRNQAEGARFTRFAWWAVAGFVPCFALAFVVGEGLISALGYPSGGSERAPLWAALVATVPALLVLVVPAVLATRFARHALRLGDARARTPMVVALTLAAVLIGMNALSGLIVFALA